MAREKTTEEVREEFLDHIRGLVDYWATVKSDDPEYVKKRGGDIKYRLGGLAHSILVTLDGCSVGLPAFIVAPLPHEDDRDYCSEAGMDWYPENHHVEDKVRADISGGLHELLRR